METFHLLSRGGSKFDKRRFNKDVQLFSASSSTKDSSGATSSKAFDALKTGDLPAELDFFKYAAGGSASQSSASKGKAKAKNEDEDEDSNDEQSPNDATSKKRKRNESDMAGALILEALYLSLINVF